jgi:two-component system OmpR family response regulator
MSIQADPTILIVDDDAGIVAMLTEYLCRNGMKVLSLATGRGLLRFVESKAPDLILLDLKLDGEDGLQALREVRQRSEVPIIIATGHRTEEMDRIAGLELGADDYVIKPLGLQELSARIKAVLRRHACDYQHRKKRAVTYRFGGWRLWSKTRELFNPKGEAIRLTNGEYALLAAFLETPQVPLAREHLLQATRVHENIFDRSIDVQILRLRKKLEYEKGAPRLIVTERGLGYVFTVAVERD